MINLGISCPNGLGVVIARVSYRIFVWEGEIFFKDGKPKLNHVLNA